MGTDFFIAIGVFPEELLAYQVSVTYCKLAKINSFEILDRILG